MAAPTGDSSFCSAGAPGCLQAASVATTARSARNAFSSDSLALCTGPPTARAAAASAASSPASSASKAARLAGAPPAAAGVAGAAPGAAPAATPPPRPCVGARQPLARASRAPRPRRTSYCSRRAVTASSRLTSASYCAACAAAQRARRAQQPRRALPPRAPRTHRHVVGVRCCRLSGFPGRLPSHKRGAKWRSQPSAAPAHRASAAPSPGLAQRTRRTHA